MSNPLNLVSEVIGNVVNKAADHFLPEKMSEDEKLKFELELEKFKHEAMTEAQSLMLNSDFFGKLNELPKPMQYLRSSVRPLLTYLLIATTAWLVWNGQEIPTELHQLDLLCLGFWFGERAVNNFLRTKRGES